MQPAQGCVPPPPKLPSSALLASPSLESLPVSASPSLDSAPDESSPVEASRLLESLAPDSRSALEAAGWDAGAGPPMNPAPAHTPWGVGATHTRHFSSPAAVQWKPSQAAQAAKRSSPRRGSAWQAAQSMAGHSSSLNCPSAREHGSPPEQPQRPQRTDESAGRGAPIAPIAAIAALGSCTHGCASCRCKRGRASQGQAGEWRQPAQNACLRPCMAKLVRSLLPYRHRRRHLRVSGMQTMHNGEQCERHNCTAGQQVWGLPYTTAAAAAAAPQPPTHRCHPLHWLQMPPLQRPLQTPQIAGALLFRRRGSSAHLNASRLVHHAAPPTWRPQALTIAARPPFCVGAGCRTPIAAYSGRTCEQVRLGVARLGSARLPEP